MCEVSDLFGYVTVYKDELLVREFNEYKAVYCGLCKSLGKEYGVLSRVILSYDCTFYALFLLFGRKVTIFFLILHQKVVLINIKNQNNG